MIETAMAFVESYSYHTFPGTTMTACCATCANGRYIIGCSDGGDGADESERERRAKMACLVKVDKYMRLLEAAYIRP